MNDRPVTNAHAAPGATDAVVDVLRTPLFTNARFLPLQPVARLPAVLNTAGVHLVVQERAAADLVMPSKLTNVMAAGRPTIATADPGTALHDVLVDHDAGLVIPPGDLEAFVAAIERLRDDPDLRAAMGRRARAYAERHLAKDAILSDFERVARRIVAEAPVRRGRVATVGTEAS